jgi:hypothetical protein
MKSKMESIIAANGYNLRIGDYFSEGWAIIRPDLGMFVLFSLLSAIVGGCLSIIPFASLLISPIISGGIFIALREADKGNTVTLNTFFLIFKENMIGQLILATLVSSILTGIGCIFFILPGIYLAVAYTFVTPIILFSGISDFWQNMEYSRKIISKNWWGFLGFLILLGIVSTLATILTLFIGILIVIPWASAVIYAAYKDVVGFEHEEKLMNLEDHLLI